MIPQIHYRVTYVYAISSLGAVLQKCVDLATDGSGADIHMQPRQSRYPDRLLERLALVDRTEVPIR